ncbi:reductase [candidate division LCP-89 bacterium B3_LCP]|uniref:Reductase n=1 Tax=candidate division LCP-89 bacterium B3_LCP TaxID=2012998 RepID=A0A532UU25_UNCL8|nr:MAG: reductase [candidate division LCP-89 bacterium B3_LCP]
MSDENTISHEKVREEVINAIKAIDNGPQVLKLYMEMCARCGTCAEQCPVYYGEPTKERNPVLRSDLIRSTFKKHTTIAGKLLGALDGAGDFDGDMEKWVTQFYECTGCRRCATFCPFGIDNSVITRKGRAIADKLGLTPDTMKSVVKTSLETHNTDGASPEAFKSAIDFLEEEMKDEHGIDIKIPVDVEGAEFFYVPPSGDVLVNPEATTGIAKVFYVLGMQDNWTMSSKCFDGANYGLFTGNDTDMKADNKPYVDEAISLGSKYMFMGECGHAYRIMKMMMEKGKWWGDLPFKVVNCMEWTADQIEAGRLEFDKSKNPMPVTYHDPCNFGRSCGIVEDPRVILKATCQDFREMYPNRGENWCCGGGGGLSAMDDIHDFRMNVSGRKKMEQVKDTGAKYVATACSNCKRQFMQLIEYHKADFAVGGVHDMLSRAIMINGKAAERIDYES